MVETINELIFHPIQKLINFFSIAMGDDDLEGF